MAEIMLEPEIIEIPKPDLSNIVTEDDEPVDIFSGKQQSLLVSALYTEGLNAVWLRWVDKEGNLLLTGQETAEQERQRAEQAHQRAERLAAQLRALGVEPEE